MTKLRLINGKGDWTDVPPTGATDGDLYHMANDFIDQEGILHPSDCLVAESGTPGMSVQVAPGILYVQNDSWAEDSVVPKFYQVVRDSIQSAVAIASNPSGSTRIDLICQKIDKVTTPNDDADNVVPIVVVAGTPGAGVPATPNDHLVLAEVTVVNGETSITNSEITDRRQRIFAGPRLTNSAIQTEADAATITFDSENGKYNKFYAEITANRTLVISNIPTGLPFLVMIKQGTTPPNTPTWWSNILWSPDGEVPTVSSVLGDIDSFVFIKLDSGSYLGFQVGFGAQ